MRELRQKLDAIKNLLAEKLSLNGKFFVNFYFLYACLSIILA